MLLQGLSLEKILPPSLTGERVFILASHNETGKNLVALGSEDEFTLNDTDKNGLEEFQSWLDKTNGWAFGFISYDVKNCIEDLQSRHLNHSEFPLIHFVRPKIVVEFNSSNNDVVFLKGQNYLSQYPSLERNIEKLFEQNDSATSSHKNSLWPRISKTQYIDAVTKLHQHIQQGDIYEINYCQEFFTEQKLENPFAIWQRLNVRTEAPFSSFIQIGNKYLLSASPERFLKKEGSKIISQPVKGTIKRGKTEQEEIQLKHELLHSEKERSENVMIVDLVRNDLSKSAKRGTVKVDELFGVYTFKTVHHLISTVSGELKDNTTFTQLLRDTFPMGSMTGAPKIRAMQLIDEYEYSRRGLYSGSVGYITPDGDFDFNVVIRSITYNAERPYISCSVGSAITALSEPEKEYEECLLKAEAIVAALA